MVYNILKSMGLGELPAGYDKKVHGPYNPSLYYGKKDTPFGEVKLGQLPGWLARRSLNPIEWSRAVSRAYWRWTLKYASARYGGMIPVYQIFAVSSLIFYGINYGKISKSLKKITVVYWLKNKLTVVLEVS